MNTPVNSKRTLGIVIAAVLLLGLGGVGIWRLAAGDSAAQDDGARPAQAAAPPEATRATSSEAATAPPTLAVSYDDDPPGSLRLEGQVLDPADRPVAGATVTLDSVPPRQTTSEEDGSFLFEGLVERRYDLTARTDEHVGGPIAHQLSAASDPVVIRLRAGASLEVDVVERGTGAPIEGATVRLAAYGEPVGTTDASGRALLRAVPSGMQVLVAEKDGYAPERQLAQVPDSTATPGRYRLELRAGAPVSGRVVDERGAGVDGARVLPVATSAILANADPRIDGIETSGGGRFTLPGVAPGRHRFIAVHGDFAPGTSDVIEVTASGRSDVEIVLQAGGVVAGRVVDASGAPAPWATVRIGPEPERESGPGDETRQAIAGEDGRFRVRGLPRSARVLVASSTEAASEPVDVDLRAVAAVEDVALVLTLDGQIRGRVVDEHGKAVAEAQVTAYPDVLDGGDLRSLSLRGPSVATTDGGGNFILRGLPVDVYLLRASNGELGPMELLGPGTRARTGDTGVQLVLPTPGSIRGRLQLDDGAPVSLAYVSIAWAGRVPVRDGAFRLDGVPPGRHDLTIRGPEFPDRILREVTVEAGRETDVGTVTVDRGRAVHGRVVDASGRPVAGATVAFGKQLVSDGHNLTAADLGAFDEELGLRRATSGADGSFRIRGIAETEAAIAAEHDQVGRSAPAPVPGGKADAQVELRLVPFGHIRGTVRRNGEPAPDVSLLIAAADGGSSGQLAIAKTGADGTFDGVRVAAGTYKVSATSGVGIASSMVSKNVTVGAGETAQVTLDIREGSVTFKVAIAGEGGATIDAAQVFLFGGEVSVKTAKELTDTYLGAGGADSAKMAFAFGPAPASFTKVTAGRHSVCVIPINGDLNDPAFGMRLQRHADSLAVYCAGVDIGAAPPEQAHTATVPPMKPLPE